MPKHSTAESWGALGLAQKSSSVSIIFCEPESERLELDDVTFIELSSKQESAVLGFRKGSCSELVAVIVLNDRGLGSAED